MSRNLEAFAMILKYSGTLWDTRRGQHVLRRAVGKIDHETSLSVVLLSFCIGCHVRFLSGTPSLTSTSACWNYTNSTWLPRNILNRLWGAKSKLLSMILNLDLFPGRSTRTPNTMASLTSSPPSSLVHPSRVYSIISLASPDPSLGLLYRLISSTCYRL